MKKLPILAILLSLFAFAHTAYAKEIQAKYAVYASGFRVLSANLTYREKEDNKYQAILDTKTSGFLGLIVPWEGVFESEGVIGKDGFSTRTHYSSAIWRDEVETKTYEYNANGTFKGLFIEGTLKPREELKIAAELADHTSDILSATLNAINIQDCSFETDIFDGKRRFKTFYKYIGDGNLVKSNYNVYEGPAKLCEVEIEPAGGEWHEKPRGWLSIQEQGRKKGSLPSFWYAPLGTQTYPENPPVLPVKVIVKTKYGTLIMNLEEISID